jgi:hypothetical protein
MDPEVQRKWDDWCDARILEMFQPDAPMGEVIAEVIHLLRKELRDEFDQKLAALRLDHSVDKSVLKSEVKQLKRLRGSVR